MREGESRGGAAGEAGQYGNTMLHLAVWNRQLDNMRWLADQVRAGPYGCEKSRHEKSLRRDLFMVQLDKMRSLANQVRASICACGERAYPSE